VVGCRPYAPGAFTPEEIPGTHFQGLSQPQGTWYILTHTSVIPYNIPWNHKGQLCMRFGVLIVALPQIQVSCDVMPGHWVNSS